MFEKRPYQNCKFNSSIAQARVGGFVQLPIGSVVFYLLSELVSLLWQSVPQKIPQIGAGLVGIDELVVVDARKMNVMFISKLAQGLFE